MKESGIRKELSITRRRFLYLSATATGGIMLAACGGSANTPAATSTRERTPVAQSVTAAATESGGATRPTDAIPASATQAPQAKRPASKTFNESPELAKLVKSGKLPAVEQRLPKKPMVIEPVERVGNYGGEWNMALRGPADSWVLLRTMEYENLVRWKPDMKQFSAEEVIPNVAESFRGNKDGTEYNFKLREGIKWSDGKPFTADDIMFWYEDVLSNEELSPGGAPAWLEASSKPVVVKKVSDYVVVFKFAAPNGLFLRHMAGPGGDAPTSFPRHYLEQFHKKYNKNVVQQAKQANIEDWMSLFFQKAETNENKDKPTLNGWIITQPLGSSTQQVMAERNPYYWKVDTEGNQLPYIDRMVYSVTSDIQVMILKALNGEIDMQDWLISAFQNKPIFYKNQQKGNYHFFDTVPSVMNNMMLQLNLTHKDPVKRKVFRNKDFRIGLSHAINRQEIIDVVQQGQGEPWQGAPRKESKFYNERLAKQYTEYDVKKANQHLDKVLPKKDAQGFRLGPNGKRFFFQLETGGSDLGATSEADYAELIKGYWTKVGIDMRVKAESRELYDTRVAGNLPDATAWSGDGGLDVVLTPIYYFPSGGGSNWAIPWGYWYEQGGLQGRIPKNVEVPVEEPPPAAKEQMKLYDQLRATPDPKKQAELMKRILEIAQEQFWLIGTVMPNQGYGIVKNNFHNVPETMMSAWLYPNPVPTNTQQYFIENK